MVIIMSLPRRGFGRNFASRGPTPIFKKRNEGFNISTAASTGVILAAITLRETGTVYAVKLGLCVSGVIDGNTADYEVVDIFIECTRTPSVIPDLSDDVVKE